jgi:hypothetical protein
MKHQETVREFYRQQGRQEMLSDIVAKFEELHEEYTRQGDSDSADLLTDLVAWLQDDFEGMSDARAKS